MREADQGMGRTKQDLALSIQSCLILWKGLECAMHQRLSCSERKGLSCHPCNSQSAAKGPSSEMYKLSQASSGKMAPVSQGQPS